MYSYLGKFFVCCSQRISSQQTGLRLEVKRLRSEQELLSLQKNFEKHDGICLPLEYLGSGHAYEFFDINGVPRAGFALVSGTKLRTIEQSPITIEDNRSLTEITAVWLDRQYKSHRVSFWLFVVGKALQSRNDELVYAVDMGKINLRKKIFNHIRAQTLYEGPVKCLDGMKHVTSEAVELATKASLFKGFMQLAAIEAYEGLWLLEK